MTTLKTICRSFKPEDLLVVASVFAGLSGCISQAATVLPPDATTMTPVIESTSTGHTDSTGQAPPLMPVSSARRCRSRARCGYFHNRQKNGG